MSLRIGSRHMRGAEVTIHVDGEPLTAHAGESVAAALLAARRRTLRRSVRGGAPRGLFCHMGACQECLVKIAGKRVPACQTPARDGLEVTTDSGW